MPGLSDVANVVAGLFGGFGYYPSGGAQATADAAEASRRASDAEKTVRAFQDRLDRLTLVCMALWALLREKTGITEQDLLKKVEEIDLSDGVLDGKVRSTVAKCAQCGRAVSPRHRRCIYCGAENLSHDPFKAAQ